MPCPPWVRRRAWAIARSSACSTADTMVRVWPNASWVVIMCALLDCGREPALVWVTAPLCIEGWRQTSHNPILDRLTNRAKSRFRPYFGDVWRGLVSLVLQYRGDTHCYAVSASYVGTP